MPRAITFTAFTSPTVLFASVADVNNFFSTITVGDATPTARGVVLKAATIAYSAASFEVADYVDIVVVDGDGVESTTQAVSKASYDELRAAFLNLSTQVAALLVNLKTAGSLATS